MEVKNPDLGTVERIDGNNMSVRLDGEKAPTLTFEVSQMRHFNHGYAVTSYSAQGLTTDRVLINMDTASHSELINNRFAYVSVSRASQDVQIYTNDSTTFGGTSQHRNHQNISGRSPTDKQRDADAIYPARTKRS